jgi:hypothetical protein
MVSCVDPGTKQQYLQPSTGTVFTVRRDAAIAQGDLYIVSGLGRGTGAISKMCKDDFIGRLRSNTNPLTVLDPKMDKVTLSNQAFGLSWSDGTSGVRGGCFASAILIGGGFEAGAHPTQGWR